jgi:hypothetical protein
MSVIELRPGQVFAGYRIEELAGHGGMGVVYRATQLLLDRTVALKLITPALADQRAFHERFQREWRLLALIDHPHVIPVYEAGEAHGRLFVSMRWVQGPNLGEMLARTAGLEPARAVAIVGQIAAALEAAHGCGLVHRDVKPANILIESRGERDHAFLSDLGISKRVDALDSITATGGWMGTLDYVAPEQLAAGPLDGRADIYSLGCVLFETLTGRVPYPRDSPMAKLSAHLHEPVPSASELHPGIPAAMDGVIARAMAKDPAERYPTAGDLARAAASATSIPRPRKGAITGEDRRTKRARGSRGNTPAAMPLRSRRWRPRRLVVLFAGAAGVVAAAGIGLLMTYGGAALRDSGSTRSPEGPREQQAGAPLRQTMPGAPRDSRVPADPKSWREQAGAGGARTFTDPHTLSIEGPRVKSALHVKVLCKVYVPDPPSVVPDGYWYRISSKPWAGSYYAPANSFRNGDIPGKRPYTHNTDFAVPNC